MSGIEEIWEKGHEQIDKDSSFDSDAILISISEGSKSITSALQKPLWLGVLTSTFAIGMLIYNCFFYSMNLRVMLPILSLLAISVLLIIFLMVQIRLIKGLDQTGLNLRDLLVYKIKYLNTRFNWAMHCVSLSIVLATFTINLTMENGDGIFELRKVLILSAFYIFVWLIVYGLSKISIRMVDRQLKNALYNLEEQSLRNMDSELRKHRRIMRVIACILILTALSGLVLFLVSLA